MLKDTIQKRYKRFQRYKDIVNILLKYGFGFLVDRMGMSFILSRLSQKILNGSRINKLSMPQRVRLLLEEMGPIYMKLGQILSVRPDLIPQEYIQELSKLRDAGPELPFEQMNEIIEKELGYPTNRVFSYVEEHPLAAASIAQVYKGFLHSGQAVIIKVQRPNIEEIIDADLAILMDLAKILEARIAESRRYNPVGIVQELSRSIHNELDFTREALNIERFRRNFSGSTEVYVPTVYWQYSSRRVLVMEYIEGVKIDQLEVLKSIGLDRKYIAAISAKAVMKQIFEDGFFHADPHPGNIFVMADGRIAFIDFGMMGRLTKEDQSYVMELMTAVLDKDIDGIVETFLKIGVLSRDVDVRTFKLDVADMLDEYYGKALGDINMGELVNRTISLAMYYGITLPVQFTLLDKALMTIEGVARYLDPEFNIFDVAKPFIKDVLRKRYFSKEALKERVEELYTSLESFLKLSPVALDALSKLSKGDAEVKFRLEDLNKTIIKFNSMINRLIFALILTAIIIGSAIVASIEKTHFFIPVAGIGTIGFVVAGIMGIWLLIDILRSKHI